MEEAVEMLFRHVTTLMQFHCVNERFKNIECYEKFNKCACLLIFMGWAISVWIMNILKIQTLTKQTLYSESKHLPEFRWWYFNRTILSLKGLCTKAGKMREREKKVFAISKLENRYKKKNT